MWLFAKIKTNSLDLVTVLFIAPSLFLFVLMALRIDHALTFNHPSRSVLPSCNPTNAQCSVLFVSMHTVQKDFTNVCVCVFRRKRHTPVAVLFTGTQTEQVLRQKQENKKEKRRRFSPVCTGACVRAPHNKREVRGVTADMPLQI